MIDWKERLADVDDDYLIGLSNKGIVKRAYKDKGEIPAEIQSREEEASVTVGEETVTVCFPLGESRCTCPSRSICRHVVQAILVLKESCLKAGTREAQTQAPEACAVQAGEADSGQNSDAIQAQNQDGTSEPNKIPEQQEELSAQGAASEQRTDGQHKTAVRKEIEEYPFAKLKKALGNRNLQSFVNQLTADIRPGIQYSSVVTVHLPGQEFVVKLLSPLEYSSCTCHKKELCAHKAAAILWCQVEAGILGREALLGEITDTAEYDMDEVKEAAGQMQRFLETLFSTGLSRVSPDVLDSLERLAIIGHNAGLARFEGYFRALSDSYDRYLKRKAAFRTEDLMGQMTRLYRRVELLAAAEDSGQVAKLAGEFRAEYLPVGNLDLIGIAMEHFQSPTGYEGETIYFLEENTKKWYTYTNARPVFYDTRKRRGYVEKSQSPWGLNLSLENLLKVRIRLTGAKCDSRNRLSSSQETKGEVTGEQKLAIADIGNWYYCNFEKLFMEQIGRQQKSWLAEQDSPGAEQGEQTQENPAQGDGFLGGGQNGVELVLVRPDSCAKAEFSQTGQQLTLPLYDKAGRELLVEVTYSKQESGTIRYLERISEKKLPCFLGKIYLKEGRMRMYPVDLLDLKEEFAAEDKDSSSAKDMAPTAQREPQEAVSVDRKSRYEVMEDLAGEALSLAEDLYQSGFDTVHESTCQNISKAAELTEQYGMKYLSELLLGLAEEISAGRHQMEKKNTPMVRLYTRLNEYLYLCRQKTAYDRGQDYYAGSR